MIDIILTTILGIVTILSRMPFQATMLDSHDAVNYALAFEHFDMRMSQPQPPGYPLYILLGKALNLLLHDDLTALVWLSTIFGGLAVVAVFLVGKEMFGRRVGIIAALLVATSTLFWYMGEIAAPYTADLFASATVGWLCYRLARSSRPIHVWLGALAIGLAGALRLQTVIFLLPLFLYSLRQHSWKRKIIALVIVGAVLGAFFLPAVMVSGGPSAFVQSMRRTVPIFRSGETLKDSANWLRYAKNAGRILIYVIAALGELAILFVFVGYLTRPHHLRFWRNPNPLFLVIWLLPTWIVYFIIWPGNIGTILVCTPPLFLLAAVGMEWVLTRPRWGMAVGGSLLALVLVWNVVLFTLLSPRPFGERYRHFDNYAQLEQNLDFYRAKLALVRQVPEEGTIIYAQLFRHLQYYLPQYHTFAPPRLYPDNPNMVRSTLSIRDGRSEQWDDIDVKSLIPAGTKTIVFFDLPSEAILADRALVEKRTKDGQSIEIISVPDNYSTLWTPGGLLIQARD